MNANYKQYEINVKNMDNHEKRNKVSHILSKCCQLQETC